MGNILENLEHRFVTAEATGGGDGLTEATAWTIHEMFDNQASGLLMNVKAGVHTLTSNIEISATAVKNYPLWIRGYARSPGDKAGKPLVYLSGSTTYTLGTATKNVIHEDLIFSSIGTYKMVQTHFNADNSMFIGCDFYSAQRIPLYAQGSVSLINCYFASRQDILEVQTSNEHFILNCVFISDTASTAGTGVLVIDQASVLVDSIVSGPPDQVETIRCGGSGGDRKIIVNNTLLNGKAGICLNDTAANQDVICNNVIWGTSGGEGSYGISAGASNPTNDIFIYQNAIGNFDTRVSAVDEAAIDIAPINLSESPIDVGSWNLNNDLSGGLLCRGKSYAPKKKNFKYLYGDNI